MKAALIGLMIATCVVVLANPACAVRVTANGSTVFFDNFEGSTVGTAPVAVTGTWTTTGDVSVADVSPPGAAKGSQYLAYSANPTITGEFTSAVTSGSLHYELMVNQPDWSPASSNGAYIQLGDSGTNRIWVLLHQTGIWNRLSDAWESTGLSWTFDTWEKYEIDYVPGAATYDLTFNDGSPVTLNARAPGNINELNLSCGGDPTTYVDAACIAGDANCDGRVTDVDASILATHWRQCNVGWAQGDFNDDRCVTDADAAILATNWQRGANDGLLDVGRRKQLLVDDYAIAKKTNVTRVLGTMTKANAARPLIVPDKPWENPPYFLLGSVLREDGKFRMWYRGAQDTICYAESADGLNWTKPNLGLVEFNGNTDNNIVTQTHPFVYCPFIDPNETDPAHKYKAACGSAPGHGVTTALAYSADGLHWTYYNDGRPVTGRAADTINQMLWDPDAKTYRLYTRTDFGPGGGDGEDRGTRDMVNPDVRGDLNNWQTVREWHFDREGPDEYKRRQIYSLNGWIYEGVQFGLLWSLEWAGDHSEGPADLVTRHERDIMNAYLVTARGNQMWDLSWVYAEEPLIPRGPDGSFDKDWVQPAVNIVTWNDQHWLYYSGAKERHGIFPDRPGAIGLATLPLDRFVALSAEGEGTLTTKTFELAGDGIQINAVTQPGGSVHLELLGADGQTIEGFGLSDAFTGNTLRHLVTFGGNSDLSSLKGQAVALRFHLNDASLYSFQVVAPEPSALAFLSGGVLLPLLVRRTLVPFRSSRKRRKS